MSKYNLAQLNIANMKYPIESREMSGFVENLDPINALADQSPGFVWRLQSDEGDATSIDFFGTGILVNMSVWTDVESLHNYVYRSAHAGIMSRRKEWFDRMQESYTVLWWIPEGRIPTLEEAREKLSQLGAHGPTPGAFTFKKTFPAPDAVAAVESRFEDLCPAT